MSSSPKWFASAQSTVEGTQLFEGPPTSEKLRYPTMFSCILPATGKAAEAIESDGAPAIIGEVLSRAPHAAATDAFHAVIRVGCGIEAGHAGAIAAGLPYPDSSFYLAATSRLV